MPHSRTWFNRQKKPLSKAAKADLTTKDGQVSDEMLLAERVVFTTEMVIYGFTSAQVTATY